jgi:iron-sulfur cluster insertion protein
MDTSNSIILTDSLADRVRELQKGDSGLMLRVVVNGGGCQGFEYKFDFATKIEDGDSAFEKDGIKVLIDADSLPLLEGSTIDFIDDLAGASFKIINPNAKSTCGCGTSFSV